MKIALIGYEANTKNRVGSNVYAFNILKALERIDKKNEYLVFLPEKPVDDLPESRKGWQYHVSGPKKFWNFFALNLALFKKREEIDLIFSPGHYAPLFKFSKPLLISIMDLGFLHFPSQFTKSIFLKLKYWTWFSAKKADLIFSISNSTRNDIIKYYRINPSKITTTYLGIDEEFFKGSVSKEQKRKIREKYKIKNDYILFLSTLKPSKNIEGLLKAFADIKDKVSQDLVIAGKKGWMFNKAFLLSKSLGLEKRVVFTGFVDKKDVRGLIAGAHAFTLLSFWEGFGIPALEAMALKVPVIVSNRGSLPEVVKDAAVLADPEDISEVCKKLLEIVNNSVLRKRLMKKGFLRAKGFTWEKCGLKTLKKLEEEYKNAL